MTTVKLLPEFRDWLASLKDGAVRGVIVSRIKRLAAGNAGDVASVGGGVSELRIRIGAGWRVYFTERGATLTVLLCGGSKKSQVATSNARRH